MRKLNLSDVFSFARMIRITNAEATLRSIMAKVDAITEERSQQLKAWNAELQGLDGDARAELAGKIKAYRNDESWVNSIGIEAIVKVLNCAGEIQAEDAVYDFLAPVLQMKPQEVADIPLADVPELLQQLIQENDLKSFFESAQKIA